MKGIKRRMEEGKREKLILGIKKGETEKEIIVIIIIIIIIIIVIGSSVAQSVQ
jgi:hypothetical protein